MSSILPLSFNDYFSWETYEKLPKSGHGTDIFFFGGNPVRHKFYAAWHIKPSSVYPHTKRYRLLKAICEKDINEVKLVLDEGFDLSSDVDHKYNYKALGLASSLNRVGIIEYLLLRGADINAKDSQGNTPLMHAVVNFQYDAIRFLLDNGADLHAKDKYGFTAADKARFRGLASIAKHLDSQKNVVKTKSFPNFTVNFDFESWFEDPVAAIYKQKKYYDPKPKVYPFNNLEGVYAAKFVNFSQ